MNRLTAIVLDMTPDDQDITIERGITLRVYPDRVIIDFHAVSPTIEISQETFTRLIEVIDRYREIMVTTGDT